MDNNKLKEDIMTHFKMRGLITPEGELTLREGSEYEAQIMIGQIIQIVNAHSNEIPFNDFKVVNEPKQRDALYREEAYKIDLEDHLKLQTLPDFLATQAETAKTHERKINKLKDLLREIEVDSRGSGNGVNTHLYNKILNVI